MFPPQRCLPAIYESPHEAALPSLAPTHPQSDLTSAMIAAATKLSPPRFSAASDGRLPSSELILAGRSYLAQPLSAKRSPSARALRRTDQPGNSAGLQRVLLWSSRTPEPPQAFLYARSTTAPEAWDISENARQKMRVRIAERQSPGPRSQIAHACSSRKCRHCRGGGSRHDLTISIDIFWIARRINLIMNSGGRCYCPALLSPATSI
jgi:hypothetical protein